MAGFIADGAQPDLAVQPNFERFDGLGPLDNRPGSNQDRPTLPRNGGSMPVSEQVYTRGPLSGVTGTLGGQPRPARCGQYKDTGDYTPAIAPGVQFRLGVGQNYQGIAQTVALSEITNAPPQPGDLTSILAGLA
jgi:hypothetical protein